MRSKRRIARFLLGVLIFTNMAIPIKADPTTSSQPTVTIEGRTFDKTELARLSDKYLEIYKLSDDIFKKWEPSLLSEDGTTKDMTRFVLSMKDKYKLQSDIFRIESSGLISLLAREAIALADQDLSAYQTSISPILEEMEAQVGLSDAGTVQHYHNKVTVRAKDTEKTGQFDLSELAEHSADALKIFTVSMMGNKGTPSTEDTEETSTENANIMTLPGVFHKAIKMTYSETAENEASQQAYDILKTYETIGLLGTNIYTEPYILDNIAKLRSDTIPATVADLGIQELPAKDIMFQMRMLGLYTISIAEELAQFTEQPQIVKSWLTENHTQYKANMEIFRDIILLYKSVGLEALAETLTVFANDQQTLMDELLNSVSLNTTEEDTQLQDAMDRNKIFENPNYYELLAWTSAFTPFETDINDYEVLMAHVSDGARNIYLDNGIGTHRTPVMAVNRNKSLAEVQAGNNIGLKQITLRQFIKQIETGDIMLFAQAMSERELNRIDSAKIEEIKTSEEGEPTDTTETIVSYNEIKASTTSDQFLGPIYFSTGDRNYGINKENKKYVRSANKTMEELEELTSLAQGYEFEKFATEITPSIELSQHLTETHGYLNYMLMHNTLENGGVNSKRVQEDLDKTLYVDFLGNILTHSGIVVVPAYANTTYYPDISKYNLSHAMFLNSYPRISSVSSAQLTLIEGDEDKLLLGLYPEKTKATTQESQGILGLGSNDVEHALETGTSNTKWKWKVLGLDKGKFTTSLNIERPNSTIYKNMKRISELEREKDPDSVLNFFNPVTGIVDVGIAYSKKNSTEVKQSAKVFTFTDFDELIITGDNYRAKVALNGVSTNALTGDWLAMISLNLNHLLDKDYSLNVMSLRTMGHLYSILMKCSDDVYSMSKYIVLEDYVESLKDNPMIRTFASIFEGINNFFLKFVDGNLLIYTPTLDNMTMFKDMSSWIIPVSVTFIAMSLALGLTYLLLGLFRQEGIDGQRLIFISLVVPLIVYMTVNVNPAILKYVFETVPSKLIKSESYVAVADEAESQYKIVNEYLFSDKEQIRKSNINLKLERLDETQAKEVRRFADENLGYVDSPMYSVRHDLSTVNVLEDKIYLRGLDYFIDIEKLFGMSEVIDIQNHDYSFRMEHDTNYGYDMIAPKIPFYHIMETLTYTINSFTEGTSAAMRTIDYGHFTMSTGRSRSYFNSIFFISPEKFTDYLEAYSHQQNKNLDDLIYNDDLDYTSEDLLKFQEELEEMTPMAQKAMVYMMEKLGDLDDWLGINKILSRSPRIAPFTEEFLPLIATNEWYPDLALLEDEEIDKKVKNINSRTKNFVLKKLVPVMGYMSDENTIKTIALYASMEFNKEFSSFERKIKPQVIELDSINNHYITRSVYMPSIDLFSSSSNSLSYYLANEGIGVLLVAILDLILRYLSYFIPIIAILLLNVMPLFLVVLYPRKDTELFLRFLSFAKITVVLALTRYIIVLGYLISVNTSNAYGPVGGVSISIAVSFLTVWLLKILIEVFLVNLVDTSKYIGDTIKESTTAMTDSLLGPDLSNYSSRFDTDLDYSTPYYQTANYYTGDTSYNNFNTDGTGWRTDETFNDNFIPPTDNSQEETPTEYYSISDKNSAIFGFGDDVSGQEDLGIEYPSQDLYEVEEDIDLSTQEPLTQDIDFNEDFTTEL